MLAAPLLVRLQVHVHAAALAEDAADAGDQLQAVFHQPIEGFGSVFAFYRVVQGVRQVDPLTAKNDRTDSKTFLLVVEIGCDERSLIGADPPGFGIAREKFYAVLSRKQREASIVFDGPLS